MVSSSLTGARSLVEAANGSAYPASASPDSGPGSIGLT